MGQVSAVLTPSSAPVVAGALIWAYRKIYGTDPPAQTSWLYPLALSANETAHWGQALPSNGMWNWNCGNISDGVCKGKVRGTAGFYRNPHVTSPINFAAFNTLGDGATGLLKTLQCMGAQASADTGDYSGFMSALESGCYAGCVPYSADLSSIASGFASIVPTAYSEGLVSNPVVSTLLVVAGIGLATGILANVIDARVLPRWARI